MTDPYALDQAPSWVTIRANAGLRAVMALLVLGSAFMTLAIAPTIDPPSQQLPVSAVSALIGVGPLLMGTTKIRVNPRWLQVVNPVFVYSVVLADVDYLDHTNGFQVVMRSGRRVGFAGSAPSLIGTISRYWSARRMIAGIEDATGRSWNTSSGWQPGTYPVTRRPRAAAALWCAAYVVAGTATALAIAAIH